MSSFHLPDAWANSGFVRQAVDHTTGAITREAFMPVHQPRHPAPPTSDQHHLAPAYVSPYAPIACSTHHRHPHTLFPGTPQPSQPPLVPTAVIPFSDLELPFNTATTADSHVPPTAPQTPPYSDRGGKEQHPWYRPFEVQIQENETLRNEAIEGLRRQEKQLNNDGSWQSYKNPRMQELVEAAKVARPTNTNAAVLPEDNVVETLQKRSDLEHPIFFDANNVQHEFGGFPGALDRLLAGKAESDPSLKLSIQNSKANEYARSGELEEWHISDVRARLESNDSSLHPVNGLDFTPLTPVLPRCLQDLGFMQDLAQPWREMKASPRLTRKPTLATAAKLGKLIKSASPWVTLAQVGPDGAALTLPHRDADGLDTYLLCAQGMVGFIWLENPSATVLRAFVSSSSTLPFGSQWRLMFLRPGQAVYFPAGLVHAVVRLPSTEKRPQEHTLLFGSHFLHPSCIVAMAQLCKQQMQSPSTVNEDPYDTAIPYLARIGLFISANEDQIDEFGGAEAVDAFWKILSSIDGRLEKNKLVARTNSTLVHFVPQIKKHRMQ